LRFLATTIYFIHQTNYNVNSQQVTGAIHKIDYDARSRKVAYGRVWGRSMPETSTDTTQIAELLPEVMRRLGGGRSIPAGIRELTFAQARALRVVAADQGCTMGALARSLHVTLGAATGLVDRLIQHRLVQREADPRDRRIVRVRLTRSGRRAHEAVVEGARQRLAAALAKLSPEQREQVAEALRMLKEALAEEGSGAL